MRKAGEHAFKLIGVTAPEAQFTVLADGIAYEVIAKSVSLYGLESSNYAHKIITTTDMVGAPDVEIIDDVLGLPTPQISGVTGMAGF